MDYELSQEDWGFWVLHQGEPIAGLIRGDHEPSGVEFVTPNDFRLQVAVMNRPFGYVIPSHVHLPVERALTGTQEVLIIKRGELRADLYTSERAYLCSVVCRKDDVLILNSGGHGFEATSDCLFFEVKQGPYVAEKDKEIFPGVPEHGIQQKVVN